MKTETNELFWNPVWEAMLESAEPAPTMRNVTKIYHTLLFSNPNLRIRG
jgi:hypothetical protein